ncbi:hypothetical protein R3X27_24725 [Tropicimonas sp. TH_r6]|uniref:hypothetical protein n=1 Tax=Tropicimonas sp. TH_r6 TaxID=3082085 RepID=UPI0029538D79|nr:hypothetical protein [Tropicimonas sp. TH_r6]MDV7145896.1 hypothetical protein [Tropicimonas sp. TH_r6]
MPQTLHSLSIEELAYRTVSLGRRVSDEAKRLNAGGTAKTVDFVSRCLRRAGERSPFHLGDEGGLDAVRGHIERAIEIETLRVEEYVDEYLLDEDGHPTVLRRVPVRTVRGDELATLLDLFDEFIATRDATLDRVASERALHKLLE